MAGNQIDLLVIGEGLAGITAAAAAADQGRRVMLVSTGPGTFVLGTAAIDLEGLTQLDDGPASHQVEDVEEALAFFAELTMCAGSAFQGGLWDRRLVPTIMGTFQTVSMAPHFLCKGDPRGLRNVAVAGIETMSGFDASFVAERLTHHSRQMDLKTLYRSTVVNLPENRRHALTPTEVAAHIDRDPAYRDCLVAELRQIVHDAELLILPGILGMKSSDDDIRQFEEDIGTTICELSTMPPSVPGLRLLRRLEGKLTNLGVEFCTGFAVRELCLENGDCTGVVLETPGRSRVLHADAIVLACGRFSGLLENDKLERSVPPPTQRINQDLQPLTSEGAVVAHNIFQCGSVLGDSEPRHGNAVAILTGYRAGMLASRQGVQYAGR